MHRINRHLPASRPPARRAPLALLSFSGRRRGAYSPPTSRRRPFSELPWWQKSLVVLRDGLGLLLFLVIPIALLVIYDLYGIAQVLK